MKNKYLTILIMAFGLPVSAMADWPVAITDSAVVHPSFFSSSIDVLANDIGRSLEVVEVNEWSEKGARVFSFPTGVSYRPPANFEGEDGFWYVMKDDQGRTNAARVSVTVLPADTELPYAQEDIIETPKDTSIRIDVLKNDIASGGEIFITQFHEWSEKNGQIEKVEVYPEEGLRQRFHLRYTPPKNFVGVDTFWYVIKDDPNTVPFGPEKWAKVTITVSASPYITTPFPVGNPDIFNFSCNRQGCVTAIEVVKNDEGKNLVLKLNSAWSLKGAEVNAGVPGIGLPSISYRPPLNFTGEDKVWYVIEDEFGRQNWSVLTINVANNS